MPKQLVKGTKQSYGTGKTVRRMTKPEQQIGTAGSSRVRPLPKGFRANAQSPHGFWMGADLPTGGARAIERRNAKRRK